jgi:geranylgeranyl transferase type-1 subunit beta
MLIIYNILIGGSSYCAVASLALFSHLWDGSVLSRADLEKLKRWALMKQERGFHGRVNKPDDTCYAFWIGAILSVSSNMFLNEKLEKCIFCRG